MPIGPATGPEGTPQSVKWPAHLLFERIPHLREKHPTARWCSLYLYGGKKEVGWFEDGDSITISFTPFAPTLLGYIRDEYGDKVLVKSEARPLAKNDSYVVKWAFNKVHECD